MDKYLAIITTVLVITQIIRVAQNTIQLRRQTQMMKEAKPAIAKMVEELKGRGENAD